MWVLYIVFLSKINFDEWLDNPLSLIHIQRVNDQFLHKLVFLKPQIISLLQSK